jgi:very-short-patch-repair endonuclease
VIELDGNQPGQADAERNEGLRTALLNQMGYRVIRFTNHQVTCELQAVLDAIYPALTNCQARGAGAPR